MPYEGPGKYRHFKGSEYEVLGLALRESDKAETYVIYKPLTSGSYLETEREDFWARALHVFDSNVDGPEFEWGGPELVPRFEKID